MTTMSGYRQPLYAGDLWEVEPKEWSYEPVLTRDEDTNDIQINFVQVPPEDLRRGNLFRKPWKRKEKNLQKKNRV